MSNLTFAKKRRRWNYDFIKSIAIWILEIAAICFVAFIGVWYYGLRVSVIGDSMRPNLSNGDVVLVNRLIYNMSTPRRGDIIVFKPKGNEETHYYVKRIVGLPGETVSVKDGTIYIDGKKLKEEYNTKKIEELGLLKEPVVLGTTEYFVLGDDRQNGEDSRNADIGNVNRSEIEGKVWFVISGKNNGFVK